MIIGKHWIKRFLKWGWIGCHPAPVNITEDSLDVTLGQHFFVLKFDLDYVNPGAAASAQFEHFVAEEAFLMRPQALYLGHTHEFVGSRAPFIVPQIRTRSTAARWGFEVGTAALFGEGGFCSRWALELHTVNDVPVLLRPGWRVGQMVFQWAVGGTLYTRQYNVPESDWKPEALLPKLME